MPRSSFIRAMHPKSAILPKPEAISRILGQGWVAQLKIHGHRAQIHVSADPKESILVYNRHGKIHQKALTPAMIREIHRLFRPREGWNVIDAEWLKPEEKIYVFDFLKKEGETLRHLPFPERWKLLPRAYLSPHLSTLPLIRDLGSCLAALASTEPHVEGLVFKAVATPGFSDTSIVRCRKRTR